MDQNHEAVLSVSQVNQYIRMLMDGDDVLTFAAVRGEISNCKLHTSGHLYFTLKDADSELAAVMFRSTASSLTFVPKNGMRVTVYGKISVYEKSGRYQLYAQAMLDDGLGALYQEFERLKKKLEAEGLFDRSRKRKLPAFPKCIGIITSPTGAAVRDMIDITGRRYPLAKLLICPALVQGSGAPASLCRALAYLNATDACDVIIIGRGGGSAEDLWAFNNETLVREVAASRIPIISAVGHETDTTLCDYAADLRAPTPSAAAELVVQDKNDLFHRIDGMGEQMDGCMNACIYRCRTELTRSAQRLKINSPEGKLKEIRRRMEQLLLRMDGANERRMKEMHHRLALAVGRLELTNPLAVLERGYGAVTNEDGHVISSVRGLHDGDLVNILLSDGQAQARIKSVTKQKRGWSAERKDCEYEERNREDRGERF